MFGRAGAAVCAAAVAFLAVGLIRGTVASLLVAVTAVVAIKHAPVVARTAVSPAGARDEGCSVTACGTAHGQPPPPAAASTTRCSLLLGESGVWRMLLEGESVVWELPAACGGEQNEVDERAEGVPMCTATCPTCPTVGRPLTAGRLAAGQTLPHAGQQRHGGLLLLARARAPLGVPSPLRLPFPCQGIARGVGGRGDLGCWWIWWIGGDAHCADTGTTLVVATENGRALSGRERAPARDQALVLPAARA